MVWKQAKMRVPVKMKNQKSFSTESKETRRNETTRLTVRNEDALDNSIASLGQERVLRSEPPRTSRLSLSELTSPLRVERNLQEKLLELLLRVASVAGSDGSIRAWVSRWRMREKNLVFWTGHEDLEDSRGS